MSGAYDTADSPGFSSAEFQLAAHELMSEDPAKEVRVFNNDRQIFTLKLNEPEKYGATKTRAIYLKNVPGPRDLLEQMSHARKMFRWRHTSRPEANTRGTGQAEGYLLGQVSANACADAGAWRLNVGEDFPVLHCVRK
jgi:hypothetical protein